MTQPHGFESVSKEAIQLDLIGQMIHIAILLIGIAISCFSHNILGVMPVKIRF